MDRTFQWLPEATGRVTKFFINIAVLMNMTARSTNEANFTDVQVTITKTGGQDVYYNESFSTGFADQDLAGEVRLFIVSHPVIGRGFPIRKGNAMNIRVRANFTQTSDNTIEMGLVPLFPMTIDSNSKFFSRSGVLFYIERQVGVFK